jgi:FlaA1/EpsC-like NDP-sugar epimerase
MTIPESARLVVQAGGMAKGGEIFILDMGEPVRIVDLARDLISISGKTPDVDIKIECIGLRPGEKLHEELLMGSEQTLETELKGIMISTGEPVARKDVAAKLKVLREALADPTSDIQAALGGRVENYCPPNNTPTEPKEDK